MKKNTLILWVICLLGTLFHASFLHLNEVLKVADSFAYLQMSYFLEQFSPKWLGTGWFGFVYSLPIALLNICIWDDFLSGKIINLILLNISALLLWKIAQKFVSINFSYLVLILFFLSPTFLHFNIHILSENIYIPLFLLLFLLVYEFTYNIAHKKNQPLLQNTMYIACLIWLLYLTRAEAFIYIWSIGIISLWLLVQRKISFQKCIQLWTVFFLSFFLFISPYLFHLYNITGEWGLTNKGASNLRQAELRGQAQMDDAGFERAVAELTPDKHQLIAGFAGGMEYNTPQIEWNLKSFILKDPKSFIHRVLINQRKLFTQNFPEIFLWKSPSLYFSEDTRFSNIFFLLFSLFPFSILIYGIYRMFREQKVFFYTTLAFFAPAFLFFTLFFTLNRYFLIFLPLLLIAFAYAIQSIWKKSHDFIEYIDIKKNLSGKNFFENIHFHKEIYHHISKKRKILWKYFILFSLVNIVSLYALSILVYYNIESPKDEYYALKQEAGIWLQQNTQNPNNLKIMERFPIVTYYSSSKTRYITPYSENIQDIYTYGTYNNVDILVVDSMDFLTYRPQLAEYLERTPENYEKLIEFNNTQGQKVILYSLKK
jgi:hypothetical protein